MRIPERLFRFRFSGIIPIFALPVLLTGCASFAPRPIVQYRNLDPDPVFVRGLQVNAYRADSLRFSVAVRDFSWDAVKYLQSHVYPLTFIVNVRNRDSAAILIDPADFSLAALPGDSAQPLIDPELVLYTSQEEIERLRAERMASDAKQAAFGFEDFAGKDDADSAAREETARKRKEARDYHRERNEFRQRIESEIRDLEARKVRWSDEPIRKTTLAPGDSLEGTLAFSIQSPFPDTLVLRYRGPCGELGHFRLQPPPEGSASSDAESRPFFWKKRRSQTGYPHP